MAVSEQMESRSIKWDAKGKIVGIRVWLVDGEPPTAKADPSLPPVNSEFPGFPSLRLDLHDAVLFNPAVPNIQSKVTSTYTSDFSGTLSGRPVDPVQPGFASWSADFRVYEQSIPFVQVNPAKYSYSDTRTNPPQERQITGYEDAEEVHSEVRMMISRRVVIQNLTLPHLDKIASLVDTIMKISGVYYRFECGPIEETEPRKWQTVYTFETDPGTPDVFISSPTVKFPTGLVSRIPGVVFTTAGQPRTFARPPFHKTIPTPGTYDPGPPPYIGETRFEAQPVKTVVLLNGYRTLPGWVD